MLNILKKEDFGYRKIRSIKMSDAKLWLIKLHNDGRGYSTLTSIKGVLRPAFRMAYQEDVVRKNPFDFAITSVVPNDSKKREALTPVETALWMSFIWNDKTYSKYYDEFVVLIGTGMRVSEFCGLTKKDLDFKNRKIRIDRLLRIKTVNCAVKELGICDHMGPELLQITRICEITPPFSRDIDLFSCFFRLLQYRNRRAAVRCGTGGHQSGRSGADDHDLPFPDIAFSVAVLHFMRCFLPFHARIHR